MRTLSAGALAVLACLILAVPASSAPSHAETGVFIAHGLDRPTPGEPYGRTEAAHAKELGVGWAAIYVGWNDLQPNGPGDSLAGPSQLHDRLFTLKEKGLKVSVTFLGTPRWANGRSTNTQPDIFYPPADPATFGTFVKAFAAEHGANIDAYELGNEPDGGIFWLPKDDPNNPAKYAAYAQAGVNAVREADPAALKFVGGLVGGNASYMERVLNAGLNGFDAVAFHSGTACKLDPPSFFNRQNAFIQATSTTAYRELIHLLKSRGMSPTVADTAAGWSTSPGMCNTPGIDPNKKGGVSEDLQAKYLREYFGCIESDPELKFAFIFELYDTSAGEKWDERMGLRNVDTSTKKSFGAMQSVFGGAPGNPKPAYEPGGYCGGYVDHKPPTVELRIDAPLLSGSHIYADQPLPIYAKGSDEHPVIDIDLFYDKQVAANEIATTTKDGVATFDNGWFGAKKLPLGDHSIIAVARDEAGNASAPVTVKVKKVDPSKLPAITTKLVATVKAKKGMKAQISGQLTWPATIIKPKGQIRCWFKQGKFVSKFNCAKANAGKKFTKTFKLRKKGKWSVSVFYDGAKPFKKSKAKKLSVKVK